MAYFLYAYSDDLGEMLENPETQRRILERKFNSMDENQDKFLEKKEYRSLRKFARTTVTPRRCSRTFIQRCDRNKDAKISKEEWFKCLGLDSPSKLQLFNFYKTNIFKYISLLFQKLNAHFDYKNFYFFKNL